MHVCIHVYACMHARMCACLGFLLCKNFFYAYPKMNLNYYSFVRKSNCDGVPYLGHQWIPFCSLFIVVSGERYVMTFLDVLSFADQGKLCR